MPKSELKLEVKGDLTEEEREAFLRAWREEMSRPGWRGEIKVTNPTRSFLNLEPLEKLALAAVLAGCVAFLCGLLVGVHLQARAERSARIFRECGLPSDEDYAACVKSLDSRSGEVHDEDLGAVSSIIEEGV